jgi:hypothetical protein
LGDTKFTSGEKLRDYLQEHKDDMAVQQPLFLLDHSGLWIKTSRYREDPGGWDTSAVGFAYISKSKALKEFGWKRLTPTCITKLRRILEAEVETYNDYLTGNVYGYKVIDPSGEEIDSVWGFIGDPEKSGLLDEAKGAVDADLRVHPAQLSLPLEMAATA